MFELVLALFMACSCPAHNHTDDKPKPIIINTNPVDTTGGPIHIPPFIRTSRR